MTTCFGHFYVGYYKPAMLSLCLTDSMLLIYLGKNLDYNFARIEKNRRCLVVAIPATGNERYKY